MRTWKRRTTTLVIALGLCAAGASSYWISSTAFAGSTKHNATERISLPESLRQGIARRSSSLAEQQITALSDGVVTYGEREAAEQAYLACGEAAGYVADVYPGSGQRITRVSFRVPVRGSADASVAKAEDALGQCAAMNLNDLDTVWGLQKAAAEPSAAEAAALYDRLDECITTDGNAWLGDVPGFAMATRLYKNAAGRNITFPAVDPGHLTLAMFQCAVAEEAETGLAFPSPTGDECIRGKVGAGMSEADARRFCPS